MGTGFNQPGGRFDPGAYNPNLPPQKSWFGRNAIWFVPLVLFLVAFPFLCCGGMAYFGMSMLTEPRDAAMESIQANEEALEMLGAPITHDSAFAVRELQSTNGEGHAEIDFRVKGSKTSADVSGQINQTGGEWKADELTLKFSDGRTLTIPAQ